MKLHRAARWLRGFALALPLLGLTTTASAVTIAQWNFDAATTAGLPAFWVSGPVISPTAGAGTLEPFVNGSSTLQGTWTVDANSPLLVPDDGTDGLRVALGSAIGTTVLITVSTIGHAGLQLSADVGRGTSLGVWGASVSTDGVNFTSIGAFPTAFGWSQGVFDLSSLTLLDDQPTVIFRLSTSSGSSSGNFASGNLDNVIVEATTVIPEPTTATLLGLGLGLAGLAVRRERVRAA